MEYLLEEHLKLYNARFLTETEKKIILRNPLKKSLWTRFCDWVLSLFGFLVPMKGFAFGTDQLTMEASTTHCAVIAQTGSGKTAKFILPTLLLNPQASFVVTDPSGELIQKSAGFLRKKGYSIQILDFREGAIHSHSFNPLAGNPTLSQLKEKSQRIVDTANQNTSGATENSQFWNTSAVNLLFCMMWLLTFQPKQHHNLTNVRVLLQRLASSKKDIHLMILNARNSELRREYESIISGDPKVVASTISTALTALDKFSDPHISALTSISNLDLSLLRKEKSALFIIVPEEKTRYFAQIISLLFQDLFEMAKQPRQGDEPYNPILFLLEEAANVGVLTGNFPEILTTIRKYNVGIAIVLQSVSQLYNAVGKANAETILGNCITKLYLSGLDDPTAQLLVQRYGQTVVQYHDLDGNVREGTRPLMTIDEIQTLPDNMGLFQHKNFRPGLLSIDSVYSHYKFKKRMKIKAKVPHDFPKIPEKFSPIQIKKAKEALMENVPLN